MKYRVTLVPSRAGVVCHTFKISFDLPNLTDLTMSDSETGKVVEKGEREMKKGARKVEEGDSEVEQQPFTLVHKTIKSTVNVSF